MSGLPTVRDGDKQDAGAKGLEMIDKRDNYKSQQIDCCYSCKHGIHDPDGTLSCRLAYGERKGCKEMRLPKRIYEYVDYLGICKRFKR